MKSIIFLIINTILLSGCATIFGGYETTIKIKNMTDSTILQDVSGKTIKITNLKRIKILTQDGSQLNMKMATPVYIETIKEKYGPLEIFYDGEISVRRNDDLRIQIQHKGKQRLEYLYPKVGLGWFFLDILTGGIGFVLDGYTGNWNEFDVLDLDKSL